MLLNNLGGQPPWKLTTVDLIHLGPLLLTGINFNPSMDKKTHVPK